MYYYIHQKRTYSISIRLFNGIGAWLIFLAVVDYLALFLLSFIGALTANPQHGAEFFVMLLLNIILFKFLQAPPEGLEYHEMKNFITESLKFGNYVRRKDHETREEIDIHNIRTIYRETSNRELTAIETETSFDKKIDRNKQFDLTNLNKTKRYFPPTYKDDMASLTRGQVTNVSSAFCFELQKSQLHSYLMYMKYFVISPDTKTLSIELSFPPEKEMFVDTGAAKTGMMENVYIALSILVAYDWFELYEKYIDRCTVTCRQTLMGEMGIEHEKSLMIFSATRKSIEDRGDRITPSAEILKFAKVEYFV
jgi:hypothetical protein